MYIRTCMLATHSIHSGRRPTDCTQPLPQHIELLMSSCSGCSTIHLQLVHRHKRAERELQNILTQCTACVPQYYFPTVRATACGVVIAYTKCLSITAQLALAQSRCASPCSCLSCQIRHYSC